jgi:RNase P/RNase MRP subunit p30
MKQFADLHLRLPLKEAHKTETMVEKAKELGYNIIGISLPFNVRKEQISHLKQVCGDRKVDFVTRVDLSPRNSNELLNELRKCRRKFEIVAVRCNTKDVARQAAKDRRVDLLQFSVTNNRKRFFDEQEAELASQALAALEIEMAPMLQLTSFSRIHLLSSLRKEVATAERADVPIVLSSGATKEQLMRGHHDFAALATIFDMHLPSALKALSEAPREIVGRNRKKLSPDYIAPGIRVVGRKSVD